MASGVNIQDLPVTPDYVRFKEDFGQKFILTVDTEEEFDWQAPLGRDNHSLATVAQLRTFQQFCESFGVVPIYLLDYPVASSPVAAEGLRDAVASGRAEVGVHLHPWVNPPFDEVVSEANSYAGNLPPELERAKFTVLRDTIERNFGAAPLINRAGRYGIGPNSAAILSDGGIAIDTSVRSRFDYSFAGGANFREHPLRPYWIDRSRGLLELPLTTVYWGLLRQFGNSLYPVMWRIPWMRGLLARIGLLERIPLTPEGVTAAEVIRGIDLALDSGLPLLVLSFHSPSIAPGHTPYVRNQRDLDAFYACWRTIFEHLAARGVAPSSVSDVMASVTLA